MENENNSENRVSEWEQVESPFSTIKAQPMNIDDENSYIIIKGDSFSTESSAFPPGNHEDLPINIPQENNNTTNNNHQSSNSQEPRPISLPPSEGIRKLWKRLHFGCLRSERFRFAGGFQKYATRRVGLWSLALASVVVMVSLLRKRVPNWWQKQMQVLASKERLMLLIKEKDKKINQLLLQIAKLNEILLARRRVPVLRVITENSPYTSL